MRVPGLVGWLFDRVVARGFIQLQRPDDLRAAIEALARLSDQIEARLRRLQAESGVATLPVITSLDGGERLLPSVLRGDPPWRSINPPASPVPGMVTEEECRYYLYLGRFFSGAGEAVELGPWLGRSTFFIVQGLKDNPHFRGKRLHVFDDFIWRSGWMDVHYTDADRPANHESFHHIFARFAEPIRSYIEVEQCRFTVYDGNDTVRPFVWNRGPIEILYVDCGRTIAANEAWYSVLEPVFVSNRTLVVLQDWGTHKELPRKPYNQIKAFVEMHGGELELVHEVAEGGIATFLYRGRR